MSLHRQITPIVPAELVEYLRELYPNTGYGPTHTYPEIMYQEGIHEIINKLESLSRTSVQDGASRHRR